MAISLDVLEITNESRGMHGLRHQDYERYRRFCTRKIHRTRKRLDLSQGDKTYQQKQVTQENATSSSHLEILLFDTERAWSYAMQLKRESAEEPRKRHHLLKRLRKAVHIAQTLASICAEDVVDARTFLDVQAYACVMEGFLLFEQQSWQEALDKFSKARTIYEKLAAASTAHQEALCYAAMDTLDPNMKYCAYHIRIKGGAQDVDALLKIKSKTGGVGMDLLTSKLDSLLNETREQRIDTSKAIEWKGHTFYIKNDQLIECMLGFEEECEKLDSLGDKTSLFKKVGQVNELDIEQAEKRLALYDSLLGRLWDATRIAETDLKKDEEAAAKVKSSKSDLNTANLRWVHGYVAYHRLARTIERNWILIQLTQHKLTRDQPKMRRGTKYDEIIKLGDTIIQSLNEMKNIPALEGDVVGEEVILAKLALYKGFRAFYVAQGHSQQSRHKQATCLYARAMEHLVTAKTHVSSLKSSKRHASAIPKEDMQELKEIEKQLATAEEWIKRGLLSEKAKCILSGKKQDSVAQVESQGAPLYENMSVYRTSFDQSQPNLIHFPPTFSAIPTKPLFFDIASNGIEYPLANLERRKDQQERVAFMGAERQADTETTEEQVENTKSTGGLMGFVSGFWSK